MKISLHSPRYIGDKDHIVQYEADEIFHTEDRCGHTVFFLRGIQKEQFCLEDVETVNKMIEENKTPKEAITKSSMLTLAVNAFWCTIVTIALGIIGSYLATILWEKFPAIAKP